ncbi:related to Transcription initiation factor TFIID subunit 10 [Saccharomycodes ludwigii]|uniref:Related to Transcription initiation factor TFIID subunit 10 n=1 Tax=Saccharomycodes ludwigii TaxID=36035 RepID=A0A376B403_9ASCO|nr:hypothetical protein SCDLUD_001802 [Saccharomycodes ludwigii]KAH3902014.1 hypothetical protein SCDLUD_001802 [Saccharomycodes ludwigii]SSD59418.1 related to Transcription initiation factor TFIID subunit 10 [Saccharomycodes ludwigii]
MDSGIIGDAPLGNDDMNEFDDNIEGPIDGMIVRTAEKNELVVDDLSDEDVDGESNDNATDESDDDDESDEEEEGYENLNESVGKDGKKKRNSEKRKKRSLKQKKRKIRLEDGSENIFQLPEFSRKDKTLKEILDLMEDNPPIIPDAVIDYFLLKNGMDLKDVKVKRLLALATQKFVSDIATDAYEYSRIRSGLAVSNANNGQTKARQLLLGQQQQQQNLPSAGNNTTSTATTNTPSTSSVPSQLQNDKSKVVLTVNDLSSAVSEYGLNISRPDFYR